MNFAGWGFIEELSSMLRQETVFEELWDAVCRSDFGGFLSDMRGVMQNPVFHGEGDVYTHTKMVCRALTEEEEFSGFSLWEQTELFVAALLHDIGKIRTTVLEDGKWTSPHHANVGSRMARTFLWQECGLCGLAEKIRFRETVCGLVRSHMKPSRLIERQDPFPLIRGIAALGEMAEDFTWQKLCILSDADMQGRIADDVPECRENTALGRILAEEAGCLYGSFPYSSSFTRYAYLCGRNVMPDQPLYNDTWGEIVMMAGLPGTGKDTWIAKNLPDLPMISLDEIRKETGISPTGDQGKVIQEARERAKTFLRRKQPFVWNATNLSKDIRQKQVRLFEQYKASVRIVYLETEEKTRIERNRSRKAAVPEAVTDRMLAKTEPPMLEEACTVEWLSV